jgi:hypothetical protein
MTATSANQVGVQTQLSFINNRILMIVVVRPWFGRGTSKHRT